MSFDGTLNSAPSWLWLNQRHVRSPQLGLEPAVIDEAGHRHALRLDPPAHVVGGNAAAGDHELDAPLLHRGGPLEGAYERLEPLRVPDVAHAQDPQRAPAISRGRSCA